ncbi:glycosyltransferase family 1 protein [Teratosphaeria destructans]|uniref:sterol 3beta-glucosyltransferase n=1 Tax=Teratosphaeria destructans TaxID=418781 RepID=A0A9W7W6C4_9PEZI|nr:glycosyltransferase family 1 protein [Teratosphaeria destructans]
MAASFRSRSPSPSRRSSLGGRTSTRERLARRTSNSRERSRKRVSMNVPERFRQDDEEEEEEEDVTGPAQKGYVQQSLYGVISAATKQQETGMGRTGMAGLDLGVDSDDSESEVEAAGEGSSRPGSARSNVEERKAASKSEGDAREKVAKPKKNKLSLRALMKPNTTRSDSQGDDAMTQSQFLPPKPTIDSGEGRHARSASVTGLRDEGMLMERRLRARQKLELESSITSTTTRRSRDTVRPGEKKAPRTLQTLLADMFHFDEPEEVIKEYSCWYLQSVMLQGFMYVTSKHICYYAYLQKKSTQTIKSGHLGKMGKHRPGYRRKYFILKGDVLSYYASAADPYFPEGNVDLRYAVSAELTPKEGDDEKNSVLFALTIEDRVYRLKAESASSAREWVRQLQKVIFRSHNDGDSVKISIPIANVVDVESNPVVGLADTVKLRVIDNEETYAIDDYFFTFFTYGREALELLKKLTSDSEASKGQVKGEDEALLLSGHVPIKTPRRSRSTVSNERSPRWSGEGQAGGRDGIRTTSSPLARSTSRSSATYARAGQDGSPRSSRGRVRSSYDRSRSSSSRSPTSESTMRESGDSSGMIEEVSAGNQKTDMSASQMLSGSGAFGAPTVFKPQPEYKERQLVDKLQKSKTDSLPVPDRSNADSAETIKKARLSPTPTGAAKPISILATPLQQVAGLYDSVKTKGISYLGSSPKDYYNKFSTAFAGGQKHYPSSDSSRPLRPSERDDIDSEAEGEEDELDNAEHERRFQEHFALPGSEKLVAVFYCWLHRVLPLYGKIYIGTSYFCFRSLLYGTRTKLKVAFKNIVNVEKEKGFRLKFPGMVLVIRGREEIFFDFSGFGLRDDCVVTVLRCLDATSRKALGGNSVLMSREEEEDAESALHEHELLQEARKDGYTEHETGESRPISSDSDSLNFAGAPPILFDDPDASMLDFKPKTSMRITCLTIGSRGDVQPYIALCKGLLADGHRPRIATHKEFGPWVESHGIEFARVEGDPAELMRICVDNGMFTPSFIYEAKSKCGDWLNGLLASSWEACQGSDLLIESPSAMTGIHIAEALGIPYFRAFTMPWTRTRAYPHAFAIPNRKMGGTYNMLTYTMFDNVFWQMSARPINRWRRKMLGLPSTGLERLQVNKVPFLYNFSPSVVVPPLDFSDWVRVTGYWFLDEGAGFKPPQTLQAFIDKARADKMKLVYIGFGSVTVADSRALTEQVVNAVLKADVRCILSKGWSDRLDNKAAALPEIQLPDSIFLIQSAPHDWLFRQIDCAVHHGGAGTTGASLRAGVPTLIRPFFGDQFFFATRVEDLGVGMHLRRISVNSLGRALWIACHDERMRTKARVLGEQIRQEDGVGTAIKAIYRDLEYARTLIKRSETVAKKQAVLEEEEGAVEEEEAWTFVENDGDATDVEVTSAVQRSWSPGRSGLQLPEKRHGSLGGMVGRKGRGG